MSVKDRKRVDLRTADGRIVAILGKDLPELALIDLVRLQDLLDRLLRVVGQVVQEVRQRRRNWRKLHDSCDMMEQ